MLNEFQTKGKKSEKKCNFFEMSERNKLGRKVTNEMLLSLGWIALVMKSKNNFGVSKRRAARGIFTLAYVCLNDFCFFYLIYECCTADIAPTYPTYNGSSDNNKNYEFG